MLPKIVVVIILTVAIAAFEPTRVYAVPFFIIALAVVFVIGKEGGMSAANLKIAELYIGAFAYLAKTNNTLIIPSNVADIAGLVASAMTVLDKTKQLGAAK